MRIIFFKLFKWIIIIWTIWMILASLPVTIIAQKWLNNSYNNTGPLKKHYINQNNTGIKHDELSLTFSNKTNAVVSDGTPNRHKEFFNFIFYVIIFIQGK